MRPKSTRVSARASTLSTASVSPSRPLSHTMRQRSNIAFRWRREMDDCPTKMDYSAKMPRSSAKIEILRRHAPSPHYRGILHAVVSAGRVRLDADYPLESVPGPGHDMVLTLQGHGGA